MDRNQAKVLLPIIQAFSEGRKIMVKARRLSDDEYNSSAVDDCSFNIKQLDYRVKPEPTYRPFKNAEECWQEMQKHQPFGWVKCADKYFSISAIDSNNNYEIDFDDYTFADGTPFGVKEEE